MTPPHKNDPGTYTVTAYDRLGRKRGSKTRPSLMTARAFACRWARMTGGSAAIHRCLFNTALGRPAYPADTQ